MAVGTVAVLVSNSSRLRIEREVFTSRLTKSCYVVGCARVFPQKTAAFWSMAQILSIALHPLGGS
ncbi:hypothetical protein D3C84_755540 [compost metagenome]